MSDLDESKNQNDQMDAQAKSHYDDDTTLQTHKSIESKLTVEQKHEKAAEATKNSDSNQGKK